jgi:3-oxoacyl-[acyl-carrier protein] reductase
MSVGLAVVSGGTRGIGLALSRRLIEMGYHVAALYRSYEQAAEKARCELGERLTTIRVDVADPIDVGRAVDRLTAGGEPITVLVNNAGINIDKPFLELTDADWERVLRVNLSGAFYLTRAIAPHLLVAAEDPQVHPVIVNIGATTGMRPRRAGVNYCASKAGLLHLTKCLALELAPRIRVNSLIPGMTWTDELVSRFRLHDARALSGVLEQIPLGRIGSTDEIADALEFLVGATSVYLTGQKLIVDGGQYMW